MTAIPPLLPPTPFSSVCCLPSIALLGLHTSIGVSQTLSRTHYCIHPLLHYALLRRACAAMIDPSPSPIRCSHHSSMITSHSLQCIHLYQFTDVSHPSSRASHINLG